MHRATAHEAGRFLRTYFKNGDWVALLLKGYRGDKSEQWTGPLAWACSPQLQEWLRRRNEEGHDVYASVNAIAAQSRSRTRRDIAAVRLVFLDVDQDARTVLREVERRSDIPVPSYVVHTSVNRAHVLWRVREFDVSVAERVQKRLAVALGGDRAATSVAQLTRLPGFWNHKHDEPCLVWVDYRTEHVYSPCDFPSPADNRTEPIVTGYSVVGYLSPAERARAYLSRTPPAVVGQHGDLHTFQACCRIVRGFALGDDEALAVLADWNARCLPPWTERELLQKIRSARHNGREPIGGLL